jgi:hypothetical protein
MRQPTFARKRRVSRQKRLLRTAIGAVLVIIVIAAIVSLAGGGSKPNVPLAHVAFAGKDIPQSDTTSNPTKSSVRSEVTQIRNMLNVWYQQAYVDPAGWKDPAFPTIAKLFDSGAQRGFAKDVSSLSIGDLIKTADRVVPVQQRADVTVLFASARTPKFAVVSVKFDARVTLKDDAQPPVLLEQRGTYHLTKNGGTWMISYYTTSQNENTIVATPSGSPS